MKISIILILFIQVISITCIKIQIDNQGEPYVSTFNLNLNQTHNISTIASNDCTDCYTGTSGPCQVSSNKVCYPYQSGTTCPPGTVQCGSSNGSNGSNTTNGSRYYKQGVNPFPTYYGSKVLWFYTCNSQFGLACSVTPTVSQILSSNVNMINMILGITVTDSNQDSWFTTPIISKCGGSQVPLPYTVSELQQLHDAGVTIQLSIGGWCYDFPQTAWSDSQVQTFVNHFEAIRTQYGGYIDGIDFDWEGYCEQHCLADYCACDWKVSGKLDWTLASQGTVTTMNLISQEMRNRGYVVTVVPMSTQIYSSSLTANQNQLVKYGLNFNAIDGLMVQWYTGSPLDICSGSSDCGCTNTYTVESWLCPSKCPRQIDCPDWSYSGESNYASQVKLIKVLSQFLNVSSQLAIGLEFYSGNNQWGPKPVVSQLIGLDNQLKLEGFNQGLAGTGGWTLAGTSENPTQNSNGFVTELSSSSNWGNYLKRCQPAGACFSQ